MPSSKPKPWAGFRSVLCPVDFSEHSRQALRYAEAMAGRSGGAMTVTYANDPLLIAAAAAALHDRQVAKRSLRELESFVNQTLTTNRKRLTCRVSIGTPSDQIMKAASSRRFDLIVMGTHGRGAVSHLLMGSVAERVVRTATCPVLTVHHPEHEFVIPDALVAVARA